MKGIQNYATKVFYSEKHAIDLKKNLEKTQSKLLKLTNLVNMNVIERLTKDFESKSYVQIASFSMIGDCDYIVTYKTLFSEWKEKRFKKNHIELFI